MSVYVRRPDETQFYCLSFDISLSDRASQLVLWPVNCETLHRQYCALQQAADKPEAYQPLLGRLKPCQWIEIPPAVLI